MQLFVQQEQHPTSKTLPVRGKTLPVRGKTLPVRGKTLPVRGKTLPVRGKTLPVRGKKLPVRGFRRGLRTSNNLRPQTTVPTVSPRNHHPTTQLTEPYLIAPNPPKSCSCGTCGRQNLIFKGFHNRGSSPKPSVQLLAQQQQ